MKPSQPSADAISLADEAITRPDDVITRPNDVITRANDDITFNNRISVFDFKKFTRGLTSLFLLVFIVGLAFTAPSVSYDDTGEYAVSSYFFGIAHPPGYPLYIMIAHLFSRFFPFGDIAFRLNILSLIFFAISCAVTANYLKALFNNRLFYILIPLFWFGCSSFLSQALIAEVQTLNVMLLTIISILTFHAFKFKNEKCLPAAALAAGLSCGNHHTALLVIPFGFAGVIYFQIRHRASVIFKSIIFFLAGSLILSVPPLRSMYDPVIDWGNVENLSNYIQSLTRYQYLEENSAPLTLLKIPELTLFWFSRSLEKGLIILLPLGLISSFILFFKKRSVFFKDSLVFLLLYFFGLSFLFLFLLNPLIGPDNDFYTDIFLIPSIVISGVLFLCALIQAASLIPWRNIKNMLIGILIIIMAANAVNTIKKEDMRDYYIFNDYITFALRTVPPDSLIITQGDPYTFTIWYFQYLKNRYTNRYAVNIQLLALPWYGASVQKSFNLPRINKTGLYNARYISNLRLRHLVNHLKGDKQIFSLSHSENLLNAEWKFIPNNLCYRVLPAPEADSLKDNPDSPEQKNLILQHRPDWEVTEKEFNENYRIRGLEKYRFKNYAGLDAAMSVYNCFYNMGVFAALENNSDYQKNSFIWFLRALKAYPRGSEALSIMGLKAYREGKPQRALKFLSAAEKNGVLSRECANTLLSLRKLLSQ